MKKLLLLLLFGLPAFGQVSNPGVTYVGSAPSGACSQAPPVQVLNSSGAIYTCDNGTWAVQGGGSGSLPSGTQGQPLINTTGTTYATSGLYYDASQFSGANAGAQITACLSAINTAAVGGTCDARSLSGAQSATASITVGDGAHATTLLLAAGNLTFSSTFQLVYRSYSRIIGQGGNGTSTVTCTSPAALFACVQSYNESATLQFPDLENFEIAVTGTPASTSAGLGISGAASADVSSGRFVNVFTTGFDRGIYMGGTHGCTCYNRFDQVAGEGTTIGVYTHNDGAFSYQVNSNTWTGGWIWGATGLDDIGGEGNHWIAPDIENSATHGFVLGGAFSEVLYPYEEATGADQLNGTNNMATIAATSWIPGAVCATCSYNTPVSPTFAFGYYPTVTSGVVASWDFNPRGNFATVFDQSSNGYNLGLTASYGTAAATWGKSGGITIASYYGVTSGTPASIPSGSASRTIVIAFRTAAIPGSRADFVGNGTSATSAKFAGAINNSTGNCVLDDFNGSPVAGPSINVADGSWHMCAFSYNGTNVVITVDGVSQTTAARTENTTASAFYVGADPGNQGVNFAGQIGYVGVWSSALSLANLATIYADWTARGLGYNPVTSVTNSGVVTLASGTATVSTASACAVAAGCIYKLANCGPNSSIGIGTLSVGTISAATSFVINSLSPTNTVLTTDASTVCWRIN